MLDGIVESVAMAYPKLSIDRAVGKAIESGDARFIDEAYIREVAGKDADRLIKVAKSAVSRVNESASQLKETVYSAVGGEQNWQTAVAAFNKGAPKELREAVAVMLDSGKTTQVKAAAQLVSQFASAGGFIRSNSRSGAPQYSAAAGGQGPAALSRSAASRAAPSAARQAPRHALLSAAPLSRARLHAATAVLP